jgi:hypothetical protein
MEYCREEEEETRRAAAAAAQEAGEEDVVEDAGKLQILAVAAICKMSFSSHPAA